MTGAEIRDSLERHAEGAEMLRVSIGVSCQDVRAHEVTAVHLVRLAFDRICEAQALLSRAAALQK